MGKSENAVLIGSVSCLLFRSVFPKTMHPFLLTSLNSAVINSQGAELDRYILPGYWSTEVQPKTSYQTQKCKWGLNFLGIYNSDVEFISVSTDECELSCWLLWNPDQMLTLGGAQWHNHCF